MPPRVTWLMPVLNGMPYLPQTLATVEAQTWRGGAELYVWDNGSTDGTLDVLGEWVPRRIPGRVFTGRPLTLGGSLAALVDAAPGELCARIDADDLNEPHRLAAQVAYLDANPSIALVGSQVEQIDAAGVPTGQDRLMPIDHEAIVDTMLCAHPVWHPTVLFRRRAVLAVGNYRDLKVAEDQDLWMRLAKRFRLANLPDRLVRYRVHATGLSNAPLAWLKFAPRKNAVFADHAGDLFGLDPRTALRLRELRHPCALAPLVTAARHRSVLSGRPTLDLLRSPPFQDAATSLARQSDGITRAAMAVLRGDTPAAGRELRRAIDRIRRRLLPGA